MTPPTGQGRLYARNAVFAFSQKDNDAAPDRYVQAPGMGTILKSVTILW